MTGDGIEELARGSASLAERRPRPAPERRPHVVLRPGRAAVHGPARGRAVPRRRARASNDGSPRRTSRTTGEVAELQRRLISEGVERQLAAAGARRGDEVVIADKAFEFIPETRRDAARRER